MAQNLNIVIAGLGTVGSSTIKLIEKNTKIFSYKLGLKINIVGIFAKNKFKKRNFEKKKYKWFDDSIKMLKQKKVDVVLELIGGNKGVAKKICYKALKNKKNLITANKALIADEGYKLAKIAEENKVKIGFEASVAGGIPIVSTLKKSFNGIKINKITGILNGTSNYILSRMERTGKNFNEILKEAIKFGYAESNPKSDLNGDDVASKIRILSSLCFHTQISGNNILIDGIYNIENKDIINAKKLGYRIKLLGITEMINKNIFERVHPCLVDVNSYIGNINGVFNASIINSSPVGQTIMQGEGAGPGPTSSALMSDLYSILRGNIKYPFITPYKLRKKIKQFNYSNYSYSCYLRFEVKDKPGVLSSITKNLSENKISIEKLMQIPDKKKRTASINIITHKTVEKRIIKCLYKLKKNKHIIKSPTFIRVVDINGN